jgi:EAL domain-containing protein (putative c-di-GMP-specific phosphodiesterase class I)
MGCQECRRGLHDYPLTMAFQPIVNINENSVFAYESLVRGPNGESARSVIQAVPESALYSFDQACRVAAIEQAAGLGLGSTSSALSINFMPNAVYEPRACIQKTLETAARVDFPTNRLIFEITESEAVTDPNHLTKIVSAYRAMGFRTALDDFGAGHSNLNLLAQFQPDIIKVDMMLIRGIDHDRVRQRLMRHCVAICNDLGIDLVAEGIETLAEYEMLKSLGVTLMQGYLLAKPGWQKLPVPACV